MNSEVTREEAAEGTTARTEASGVVRRDDGTRAAGAASPARAWTTGWTAGVAHALGAALLLITEFVRGDVAGLGERVPPGARLPGYADGFRHLVDVLDGQWWFRAAEDVRDAVSFGEPRAALWAAVCAALVVRLNADGPPRLQCFLSLAGAFYCVVAALTAVPFWALPGAALPFVLVAGTTAVVAATPTRWRRRPG